MYVFNSYFNGIPISFHSNLKNEVEVTHLLNREEIASIFDDCDGKVFINTEKLNHQRNLNRFLSDINENLEIGDYFFGFFETLQASKRNIYFQKIPILGFISRLCYFILHRVFPKIYGFRTFYFWIYKKPNRLFSKAEILGRLIYNGFEIHKVENHFGLCFFKVKKIDTPIRNRKVNYGLIFKMPRTGKGGKTIFVYKIRTMHPYSEYLQDYMMKELGFAENGKITNDFRITPWGHFFRKYWLDELPQLINVLKGDMKLIGVRPVSLSYFNMLPGKIQQMREMHKPGCIPPYLAFDKKTNLKNIIISEYVYMKMKQKKPYFTDIFIFLKALKNVLFKFKRGA